MCLFGSGTDYGRRAEDGRNYINEMETENTRIQSEAAKKNANIVTVDPSKIVDDNGNPIDLESASSLRRWLIRRYGGQEVEVLDNGRTVKLRKKELQDSIKKRGKEQRLVYAELDNLLTNSIYSGFEPGDTKHPWVDRQDIYYAAARIGKDVFGIRFKVDIRKNGVETYKDHKVIRADDVEKLNVKESPSPYRGVSPRGIEGDSETPPSPYVGLSSTGTKGSPKTMPVLKIQEAMGLPTNNVTQSPPKVNTQSENNLKTSFSELYREIQGCMDAEMTPFRTLG